MAPSLEAGAEKRIDHRDRSRRVGVFAAEAKNVRIVVLARDDCFVDRADIGCANVRVAVGGNAHADTRGAGKDAEFVGFVSHTAGDYIRVVGVINRTIAMSAEIMDLMADRLQMGKDGVFQIEGSVVGSNGNAKSRMAHDVARFKTERAGLEIGKFTESEK
jgi:hypothetical protein